jgi:hypothetical protein
VRSAICPEVAQAGGYHLAEPGDKSDQRGGDTEIVEERPDPAIRALVRHVGEQADDAEANDEAECGRAL